MSFLAKDCQLDAAGEAARPSSLRCVGAAFLTTLWFGLLTGWLELGLVMAWRRIQPRASVDTLRTNLHVAWMILASDALLFAACGTVAAVLAWFFPSLARKTVVYASVVLSVWALLLNIPGLYAAAGLLLAGGIATKAGSWFLDRGDRLDRYVRRSLPLLGLATVVLVGIGYARAISAEERALARCPRAKPGTPNVLLIVLDTVRASCLSLYGHNRPTTPNLERLARKAVVFAEARATAPWTGPTHASLMTGRWPHELSIAPDVPLDGTFPTLAEVLGREGFATAGFVGNIFMCNRVYGFGRGFARFEDAYENQTVSLFETIWSCGLGKRLIAALGYSTTLDDCVTLRRKTAAMLNQDLLRWLKGVPTGRPFFAFVNYYDAHRPYSFCEGSDTRFGMAALPMTEQMAIDRRYLDRTKGKPIPPGFTHDQIVDDAYVMFHDCYDSCIANLDRQVGLLLDEMERGGLLENTLVIVTADHGEQLGERGVVAHGASVYRSEVHVPLLVVPPSGMKAPRLVHQPVSLRDVPATIAECVRIGGRSPFPGRSLTRFLGDEAPDPAEELPVLCELEHNVVFHDWTAIPPPFGPASCLVSRDHVYIQKPDGHEELYDLWNDPQESDDLIELPKSGPVIAAFRTQLNQLRGGEPFPRR